jgi:hypothetical protein
MIAALLGMSLGLVAGVRHAFEPDHVAAVTTMAAGEKRWSRLVGFATSWGLGHGVMLVGVGGLMFALHAVMPDRVGDILELFVALALVGLGFRALVLAKQAGSHGPLASHAHGPHDHANVHVHRGPSGHVHVGRVTFVRLPFIVGLVHGLSGSGALTALAASKLYSLGEGLAFMALYASGAVLGMALLAGIAGAPLAHLAQRPAVSRGLVAASGLLSLSVGLAWGYPILSRF